MCLVSEHRGKRIYSVRPASGGSHNGCTHLGSDRLVMVRDPIRPECGLGGIDIGTTLKDDEGHSGYGCSLEVIT